METNADRQTLTNRHRHTETDRQTQTDTQTDTERKTQTDRHRQKDTNGQIIVNLCVLQSQIVCKNLDFLQAWLELIWSPAGVAGPQLEAKGEVKEGAFIAEGVLAANARGAAI